MKRLQSRFGVRLAGGQGPLADKVFRIAHLGILDELDILSTIAAIELVLVEMGEPAKLAVGVAAASQVFAEGVVPHEEVKARISCQESLF